jgi:uncharacterized protein (TIGR03437 family)
MILTMRVFPLGLIYLVAISPGIAQTINNQALTGKYFFRHVSIGTDSRSLLGTMIFDGAGHFTFTGQLVAGTGAASAQAGAGAYAIDAAGMLALDSPLRVGEKLNARFAPGALVGSTTESSSNNFDFFAAIPAPTANTTTASFNGLYWTATIEFPNGSTANARNTIFGLNASGQGTFAPFTVSGHAINLSRGTPTTQQVNGAAYTAAVDGTMSASFGAGPLVNSNKTLLLSKDGNIFIGGSTAAGSHDIWIGIKAASGVSNTTWNGNFWAAGLRFDSEAISGYAGAVLSRGTGKLYWTRRLKASGVGALDFTGTNSYSLQPDGSGGAELVQVGLGTGAFIGSAVNKNDPAAFEIYLGVQMPSETTSGTVFLDPQGVVNAASFAPVGNPVSPGQSIALYGQGLAKGNLGVNPPYPLQLNGVTVTVNNVPAALLGVSSTQVNAFVPYGVTGSTATIVLQNGSANSNAVTVPLAATSPGMLTPDRTGSGPGAIRHADYSQVTGAHPAVGGEIVLLFLTGLGAVNPPVKDGMAGGANPPSTTTAPVTVLVGGRPGTVLFSGLAPGYPGLYQVNVQLPPVPPGVTTLPLAISTPNAYHDQVDIPVQ